MVAATHSHADTLLQSDTGFPGLHMQVNVLLSQDSITWQVLASMEYHSVMSSDDQTLGYISDNKSKNKIHYPPKKNTQKVVCVQRDVRF